MKCQWCGKEFTPLKSWQRYCSPACRVAANRKRLPKDEVHTQETVLIRSFWCLQRDLSGSPAQSQHRVRQKVIREQKKKG